MDKSLLRKAKMLYKRLDNSLCRPQYFQTVNKKVEENENEGEKKTLSSMKRNY